MLTVAVTNITACTINSTYKTLDEALDALAVVRQRPFYLIRVVDEIGDILTCLPSGSFLVNGKKRLSEDQYEKIYEMLKP